MPKEPRFAPIDDRILDATIAEFGEHGFDDARLEDIARRAAVELEDVIERFGSKRGLLLPMFRKVKGDPGGSLIPEFGTRSGSEELASLVHAFRKGLLADPAQHRLEIMMMPQVLGRDRTFQPLVQELYRNWRGLLRFFLQRAAAEGRLADGVDPTEGALLINAALIGLRFQWFLDPDGVDLETSFDALARVLERALLKDPGDGDGGA